MYGTAPLSIAHIIVRMRSVGCSKPEFDTHYPDMMQGKLSREEWAGAMHQLNCVTRTHYSPPWIGVVVLMLCLVPSLAWVFVTSLWESDVWWLVPVVVQLVVFLGCMHFLRRRRYKFRTALMAELDLLNAQFIERGVSFNVGSNYSTYYHEHILVDLVNVAPPPGAYQPGVPVYANAPYAAHPHVPTAYDNIPGYQGDAAAQPHAPQPYAAPYRNPGYGVVHDYDAK